MSVTDGGPRPATAAAGTLACAWLLALAGCSGAVPDGGAGLEDGTATLTPAAVPDDPEAGLAPGIGDRRVTDRDVAVTAHRGRLAAAGYELTYDRTVAGPNGTLDRVRARATVVPDRRGYAFTRVRRTAFGYTGPSYSRIDVWYRSGVVRSRFVDPGRDSHRWRTDDASEGGPLADPTRARRTVATLAAFEYRVVDRRRVGGATRYRVRGDRLVRPALLPVPGTLAAPRNATLAATVTDAGAVLAYDLRFGTRYRGRPVTVRVRYAVETGGVTAVPRPTWLRAANASTAGGAVP